MNTSKKVCSILVTIGALVLAPASVAAAAAPAPVNVYTPQEEAQVSSWLTSHGVASDTAAALVRKIDAGGKLDSGVGINPTNVKVTTEGGARVTTSTYADGSVKVSKIDQPAAAPSVGVLGVSPRSITSCSGSQTAPGTGAFSNCLANIQNGVVTANFRFDYRISRGAYGAITYAGRGTVTGVGGISGETVKVGRSLESQYAPASATHRWNATAGAASSSSYHGVNLRNGYVTEVSRL